MKMIHSLRVLVLFALYGQLSASAIPIWELLSHQEKIGQLMYLFLHLVNSYCKNSSIPDCERVLTLYGTSNLVNLNEETLDLMDPYQRNAREIIWSHVTNGAFELSPEIRSDRLPTNPHPEIEEEANKIDDYDITFPDYSEYQDPAATSNDPHPHAVRVLPPSSFIQENKNSGNILLLNPGDSLPAEAHASAHRDSQVVEMKNPPFEIIAKYDEESASRFTNQHNNKKDISPSSTYKKANTGGGSSLSNFNKEPILHQILKI